MEIIRISYFYDHPLQGYGRLDNTNEIVAFMILEDDGWTKLSDIIDMNIIKCLDGTIKPDISNLNPDKYHGRIGKDINELLSYFGDEEDEGGWFICQWGNYDIYQTPSDIDIDKWINPIEANWKFIKNLYERYIYRKNDCKYCV